MLKMIYQLLLLKIEDQRNNPPLASRLEVPESQVIDERPQLFSLVLPVIFVCFEDVKKLRLSSF